MDGVDAGVVDQQVKAVHLRMHQGVGLANGLDVADVHPDNRKTLRVGRFQFLQLPRGLRPPAAGEDLIAPREVAARELQSEAAVRTGYQNALHDG